MTSELFKTQQNWSIHLQQPVPIPKVEQTAHNLQLIPTSFVLQRTIPCISQYTSAISILLKIYFENSLHL
jgi:hypothetical protein